MKYKVGDTVVIKGPEKLEKILTRNYRVTDEHYELINNIAHKKMIIKDINGINYLFDNPVKKNMLVSIEEEFIKRSVEPGPKITQWKLQMHVLI